MARDDSPPMPDPDEARALSGLDEGTNPGYADDRRREDPATGTRHGDGRRRDLPDPEVGDWNRDGAPEGGERERQNDV